MKIKNFAFCLFCFFLIIKAEAQQIEKNEELGEVMRIIGSAQSLPFLSFQFTTIVEDSASDAILSLQKDTINGIYKLHQERYWAMFDSVEYIQGFNYNLAIYHDEKLIAVGKPSFNIPALQLPVLDSSFQQAHVKNMSITQVSTGRREFKIEFYDESPYSGYEMQYNENTYGVYSITYYIKNGYVREDETTSTAKITTTIFNYNTTEFSADYFLEEKYIYKGTNGFNTRPAYTGYQIIVTADDL